MMQDQPPLTSRDGSRKRNPPERCPCLDSGNSTQDEHTIPHHDQGDVLNDGSVPCVEEVFLVADDQCLQEPIPSEVIRDGHHNSRSSEECVTCHANDDDVVPESQGGKPVTPTTHHGPHCSDKSTDPSNSKQYLPEQACAIPNIHSGLQSVNSSSSPSNNEESSPMDTTSPDSLLKLSRSPHPSVPVEPPDKLNTALNICPELQRSERSPNPTTLQESLLAASHILSPNIHLKLQSEDMSLDIINPEESTHDKTPTTTPDIRPDFHNSERSPHTTTPQQFFHDVSQTLMADNHLKLQSEDMSLDITNPEESIQHETHITTPNIGPGLQNMNRSPRDSKEKSSLKSHTITTNFRSAVNRSSDPSHPKGCSYQSHTDQIVYSGLHSLDRSMDPSNVESSPIKGHMLAPNIFSSSLDKSCAFALYIHQGPRSVDTSADPSNPKESNSDYSDKATLHSGPPTVDRLPVTLNPEVCHPMDSQIQQKPSTRSDATPNVNSEFHSEDRPPEPCYPDEPSAVSNTILHINSRPHNADTAPNPCYPDELSAIPHTVPDISSGPHSEDSPLDHCYPDELSASSNTIPLVNSGFHYADKIPEPASLGIMSLVKLHTVASSSRSPCRNNLQESLSDNYHSLSPNIHSDHHITGRSLNFIHTEKAHTGTPDIHLGLSSVDTQNSQESASINSPVIISSELNRTLNSAYSEESSASHDAPFIHSGFQKADRLLQHPHLRVSSHLKSHGGSWNVHSLTNGSPDPTYSIKSSKRPRTHMNPELHTTNRSLHPSNPEESSLDIAHTVHQTMHPVHHNAVRSQEITNPKESCDEKSHNGTSDIHPGHHSFNRTSDLEGFCPTKSVIVTPHIYSELKNSINSSFFAKSSGSHTGPNIHSVRQMADQSLDPLIPEHLSSRTLLVVTLNVQPKCHSVDKSPCPYPEEYSFMKSPIISTNIRSIRGRSPVPNESSDRCSTAPNINTELHSPHTPLHLSYPEESSDITHAVNPSPHSGLHNEDRTLDTELSVHMQSSDVAPNVDSLNRPLDLRYPVGSTAKSYLSSTIHAEYHSENRSPDSSVAVQYPSSASLGVTSNVISELQIVNGSPSLSHSKESPSIELLSPTERPSGPSNPQEYSIGVPHTVALDLQSCYGLLYPNSIAEESSTKVHTVCPNTPPELHRVDRSPDPKVSFHADSQYVIQETLLEHHNVCRSPSPTNPNDYSSMGSHSMTLNSLSELADQCQVPSGLHESSQAVTLNIHLEPHSGDNLPCNPVEFPPRSHAVSPTIYPESKSNEDRSSKSLELEGSSLVKSHDIVPDTHLESHEAITPTIHPELKSCMDRSSKSPEPDGSSLETSHVVIPNIHLEPCKAISPAMHPESKSSVDLSSKSSKPKGSFLDILHDVIPKIHLQPCKAITPTIHPEPTRSMDRSIKSSEAQGSSLEKSCVVIPNINLEPHKTITPTIHPEWKNNMKRLMSSKPEQSSLKKLHVIPNSHLEPSKAITSTSHPERKSGVNRSSKSSEPKGTFLEKSHDVIPNIYLEPHKNITPTIHPEPKSRVNRSSKSSDAKGSILEKLHDIPNSHLEPYKAIISTIHPEPKSNVNRASKSSEPEGSSLEKSHAISPTIHSEPESSVNRSSESSEPKESLEKLHDVIPKIHLDPHKFERSPDTSNTVKTSSVKPFSGTLYTSLAVQKPLELSNSEKHFENKSHARTTNISSGFDIADGSSDPSDPKKLLPDSSVLLSKKTEQNGFTKFSCSVCCRSFRRHSIFLKHWEMYCGKMLRKKTLRKHSGKIQSGKKSVPPAKRGEIIKKKAVVLKEPNTQTPKTKFKCPECGKFFSQKSNLLQHRRIHTGVKPFSCLHCGKCFTKKISLETHIRIHSGERPFSCPNCNKCYGQRAHLDRHKRTHTGEKPYPCPECGKSFLQKCDLVKHQRIHAGLRPYRCCECGKTFTESSGLRRHRKLHQ